MKLLNITAPSFVLAIIQVLPHGKYIGVLLKGGIGFDEFDAVIFEGLEDLLHHHRRHTLAQIFIGDPHQIQISAVVIMHGA